MKFTGHFTGPQLNLKAWEAELRTHLTKKLHEYTREWLRAVTGRVPVWSGMSRASLLELKELVGGRIYIRPKVKSRIPQGRALGTATPNITDTDFSITIVTQVPHYTYQEYRRSPRGGSPKAPWFSLFAGSEAFRAIAQDVKLPAVTFKPFVRTI
ncbi:hypothetical protein LCGC14_2226910 [marine sediment metagenome]|uniref:Uncharacterized protein n=1 Tax=marine sediment metagenome TaxID=412755 RepID=A0A0F9D9D9_9ZZZZ